MQQTQEANVPPQAKDLEEVVLGAVLMEGKSTYELVFDILHSENCFYDPNHAALWDKFQEMDSKGIPVDLVSVATQCADSNELKEIWTGYNLTALTLKVNSSANIESYCRVIQEKYIAREIIATCHNSIRSAYANEDVFDILQYTEDAVFELTVGKVGSDFRSIASIAEEGMKKIINQVNNPKALTGIPTGFPSLDRITGGWQDSDLIILAARPGLGKTAFALNLAKAAADSNKGVGFFTLEMGYSQIFHRQLAMESLVPLNFIKKGDLSNVQLEQVAAASSALGKKKIYIDDEAAISLFDLRAKARRMKTKHGIGLLIVDYLQLMRGENKGNREQEVASISRGLKALAKSLNIPVIALSQLSRAIETRGGEKARRPQLSDLRESGSIEQDANMVMFLSRADYQITDGNIDPSVANTAELTIAKNRDGELTEITLDTDLSTQRFFEQTTPFAPIVPDDPGAVFRNREFTHFSEPTKTNDDVEAPF